ncbi:GGDEF domain-containing protein [Lacticaseibacillus brantae]|uniref:GGDEF domain-containing protein n=1 Tax=Lacticaseibacillus brantae TaxID=943673 RepID=UPI000709A91A|nr:GGDEF domain-containing protein [Lacticaseibacillus brantae]
MIQSTVLVVITDIFWVLGVILVYQFLMRTLSNPTETHHGAMSVLGLEWLSIAYFGVISIYLELLSQQAGNSLMFNNFRVIFLLFTTAFLSTGDALVLLAVGTGARLAVFGVSAASLWLNGIFAAIGLVMIAAKRLSWLKTGWFLTLGFILTSCSWWAVSLWGASVGLSLTGIHPVLASVELAILLAGVYYALTVLTQTNEFMWEMTRMATTDALTQLHNYNDFSQSYAEIVAHEREVDGDLAVVALDIDHFKAINDHYGHPAGNAVLRYLGVTLTKIASPEVRPYRIGGEEFELIITGHSRARVAAIISSIQHVIETQPAFYNDQPIQVTISIGVAWAQNEAYQPDQLFERADSMLYEAKRSGRNQAKFDQAFDHVARVTH